MTSMSSIFSWLSSAKNKNKEPVCPTLSREMAFVGLLVEMAHIDAQLDDREMEAIKKIIQERLNLKEEDALLLLRDAYEMMQKDYDHRPCTKTVSASFSREDKLVLLEDLWRILLADHHVDVRENKMMRAVQLALGLSLEDVEQARVRANSLDPRKPLECSSQG